MNENPEREPEEWQLVGSMELDGELPRRVSEITQAPTPSSPSSGGISATPELRDIANAYKEQAEALEREFQQARQDIANLSAALEGAQGIYVKATAELSIARQELANLQLRSGVTIERLEKEIERLKGGGPV